MLPFKTILPLDRQLRTPLYLQISNAFIQKITQGVIPVGLKLPGGRKLSELLEVSRRTAMLAYEELEAQGWIVIKPNQGTFISSEIPISRNRNLPIENTVKPLSKSHFGLNDELDFLDYYAPPNLRQIKYVFDTGYPDVRLAPLKELSQSMGRVLMSKQNPKIMNYAADFNGHIQLRQAVVQYLAESRGINIGLDNLIITRGSLMAFSSIFKVLLTPGDKVIVGDVSFRVAKDIIRIAQGQLVPVPVDEHGMDIDAIEKICQQQTIRAVFVMPHHHQPTTVSLTAARRVKLLQLAETYRFAIVEDDYDYDFHYASSPILPMASSDHHGVVLYVGSFSKTVAPGLRLGFIVAPTDFVKELSRLSRFLDCHGNTALEKAMASLFKEGIIRRHLKKSLKIYRQRRDLFCALLQEKIGAYVQFEVPEGGLAAWVTFNSKIPLAELREVAVSKGLLISRSVFQDGNGQSLNAIRMGFASLNEEELVAAVDVLQHAIRVILSDK
ncbi:MAG: PLP-dependent aminotransferase family protein [Bacteroidota bacterium]